MCSSDVAICSQDLTVHDITHERAKKTGSAELFDSAVLRCIVFWKTIPLRLLVDNCGNYLRAFTAL
jgi:hypothetical protein